MERNLELAASYAFCQKIARTRARNFYYSFLLLSREQRDAMCAIYAFMRYCDDISEGEGASREGIERWRCDLDLALQGQCGDNLLWPAFHDTVQRFAIPHEYFYEMIAGVSSDLQPKQLQTFDELYRYCYQVASVVGLTIIHIFGFESPDALALAEKCGIAFQLTNILRDVREDRENGRIYIPEEDIRKFGADLSKHDERFVKLMSFEAQRARAYYDESRPLIALVHARSRPSLWALIEIYRRLLSRIERSNFDVLEKRIRVPTWEKLSILASAALRQRWTPMWYFVPWALGAALAFHGWQSDRTVAEREQTVLRTITAHEPAYHNRYRYSFSVEYYDPADPTTNALTDFTDLE